MAQDQISEKIAQADQWVRGERPVGLLPPAPPRPVPSPDRWLGLLILPALLFVVILFLVPVGRFLWLSVENSELTEGLPLTLAALAEAETQTLEKTAAPPGIQPQPQAGGDRAESLSPLPPEPVFAALVQDLAAARAERRDGLIAQALNQRLVGTRLLVIRSAQAAERGELTPPYRASLLKAFPGWADPALWQVLARDSGALTDFHLLTSLDLRRSPDGDIAGAPETEAQFRRVLSRTIWISAVVTALCAVLALPVAAAITSAPPRLGRVLLVLVLFPLWTSLLVRTVIWIIVLQRNGPINGILQSLGLIEQPLSLIYTRLSLYLAMVQVLLPLMVLSLVAVERRIPRSYMKAAISLGAPWFYAWRTVHLPLLLPGLIAGAGIVFVFALGYYVTPLLVGGPSEQMISSLIAFYTNQTLNWGLAAALSLQVLLLVVTAGLGLAMLTKFGRPVALVGSPRTGEGSGYEGGSAEPRHPIYDQITYNTTNKLRDDLNPISQQKDATSTPSRRLLTSPQKGQMR